MIKDEKKDGILANADEKLFDKKLEGDKVLKEKVIEEELAVGKREIEKGGVRVTSRVTEKPVQETVTLRREDVTVERNPVDRPATEADFDTTPRTFEMREKDEEAIIEKKPRVVEEVVVRKEATERTETISDTVRRKDVDVEQLPGGLHTTERYGTFEPAFKSNFESTYGKSYDWQSYEPAYKYGASLADDERYKGMEWKKVENVARTDWETREPGSWERFKAAVKHAWDSVVNPGGTPSSI